MDLFKMLSVAFCYILHCEYEFPSDPLANQRGSREFNGNEVDGEWSHPKTYPTAYTKAGVLEGYFMKTIKGRVISAFDGIPYGEDTGGHNRFMPPLPKAQWSGIRHAKNVGSKCLQLHLYHFLQLVGSEDCLFLNVYTPKISNEKIQGPLPVMVFIHGGSWYFGSGSEYGPAYLLEHDMILVTLNYRLGILGFLSTEDEVLPGNLGLKDQSLALTWVQENIEAFGGDPLQVTIAGQSAGGASVHLHMLSSMSRGKFSRAVSTSGSAFSPWTIMNSRFIQNRNGKLAKRAGCPQHPSEAFVDCLKRKTGRRLGILLLSVFDMGVIPTVPLGAVVEPNLPGAFLAAHPDDLYARDDVAPVPWICIRNANETQVVFTRELTPPYVQAHKLMAAHLLLVAALFGFSPQNVRPLWRIFAPIFMDYQFVASDKKESREITDKIDEFYTKANVHTEGSVYSEAATDRIVGYGLHKSAQLHSQLAPTYSGLYAFQAKSSLFSLAGSDPKRYGVSHTDDLPIYFNKSEYYPGYRTTDSDFAMVKLVTNLFYSFASKGAPLFTANGTDYQIWDPVTDPTDVHVLSINEEVKMIPEPHTARYKFWETVGLADIESFIPNKKIYKNFMLDFRKNLVKIDTIYIRSEV